MVSKQDEKDKKNATEGGESQGPDEETVLRRMLQVPPSPHKSLVGAKKQA